MLRNSIDKMNNIFESIVDFMEENGSIQKEYRDVYFIRIADNRCVYYQHRIGCDHWRIHGELFYCVIFLLAFILLRQEAGADIMLPGGKAAIFFHVGF